MVLALAQRSQLLTSLTGTRQRSSEPVTVGGTVLKDWPYATMHVATVMARRKRNQLRCDKRAKPGRFGECLDFQPYLRYLLEGGEKRTSEDPSCVGGHILRRATEERGSGQA